MEEQAGSLHYLQEDGRYVGRVIDLFSGFGTHDTLQLQLRPTRDDLDASKARLETALLHAVDGFLGAYLRNQISSPIQSILLLGHRFAGHA